MSKFAVFCPVKDERLFSPIWLEYYSRYLPLTDIYFLDFNSANLDHINCSVIKTDKNIFDAKILFHEIKHTHTQLLKSYEYVIPTDVDELLYHPAGLDEYIKNTTKNNIKSHGYEVLHLPDKEPDYNPNEKIFKQRNYWYREPVHYDKTLITNKTLNWWIGLHGTYEPVDYVDKDLLLIHLHRFDFKTCIERHLNFANKEWSEDTIKCNHNRHYRVKDRDKVIENYFAPKQHVTKIPEDFKNKINI